MLRLILSCAVLCCLTAHGQITPSAQGPEVELSSKRSEIVLNGFWKFQPAAESTSERPDPGDWGIIPVPGSWQRSGWSHGAGGMNGVVEQGKGESWKTLGQELGRGWYEREITVPASWAGRRIMLDFQRVSTDASVFVNDKKCGEINWPYGLVDITSAVQAGKTATVRVLVAATTDSAESIVWMGTAPGQNTKVKTKLMSSGLTGEVFLRSMPAGPRVDSVFVQPSFRNKELGVDVQFLDVSGAGEAKITARLLNAAGDEEKSFESVVALKAEKDQTVRVAWTWDNPRLWEIGKPELYKLQLSVEGAGVSDVFSQTFGFREIWIEGRDFVLNGKKLRLRPVLAESLGGESFDVSEIDGKLKGFLKAGFNIVQLWPVDHFNRGQPAAHRELWAERASALGVPLIGVAASMNRSIFGNNYQLLWDKNRDRWMADMKREMKRTRNEPSIFLWGTSANLFNQFADQDPRNIGRKNYLPKELEQKIRPAGDEALAALRKADPTRPIFAHAGNRMGDVFSTNNYLNLIPIQEREEWPSEWVKSGDMPYIAIEFGNPVHCDMMRGRNGFQNAVTSEPWLTEFSAAAFGADAYRNEGAIYRRAVRMKHESSKVWSSWHSHDSPLRLDPNFQNLQSEIMTSTWRSWRTWGLSAMLPWNLVDNSLFSLRKPQSTPQQPQPGQRGATSLNTDASQLHWLEPEGGWTVLPAGKTMLSLVGETLAWIAGPSSAFTDKDHQFRAGETLAKQVVFINDSRDAKPFSAKWNVSLGGVTLAEGEKTGELAPAEILFVPVETAFAASAVGAGEISLTAEIDGKPFADTFAFRVHAPQQPAARRVALWDEVGETRAMLEKTGVSILEWRGQPTMDLVVIGRKTLSSGKKPPADLEKFVASGGRLLVMAQDPDWLRNSLNFRVSRFSSRRVFPMATAPEAFRNVGLDQLRDWRGSSTLVEAHPQYDKSSTPPFGWRWGQTGAVASAALEKPHRSGWRPLFECEFDLAYSPLLELDFGKGRLHFCGFDFEDHAPADPAATALWEKVLAHANTAPLAPRVPGVTYLGDDAGVKLLSTLGVVFQTSGALPPAPAVAVLGQGANVSVADLEKFTAFGGRVLVLAAGQSTEGSPSHFGTTIAMTKSFPGARGDLAPWPELSGLSLSDLRFRSDADWPLLQAAAGLEITADGLLARRIKGRGGVWYAQLDPALLDAEKRPWMRFTRWRHTRALSQILANLGASFTADAEFFHPKNADAIPRLDGEWKVTVTSSLPSAISADSPHQDPGISPGARALTGEVADEMQMQPFTAPGTLAAWEQADGEAVFRKTLMLPESWAGKVLRVNLGKLDDFDEVYFNGQKIGATDMATKNAWSVSRNYRVPVGLAKAGANVIAVRMFDAYGGGGFIGRSESLSIRPVMTEKAQLGYYHPDYWDDTDLGDEPYRYYRW